VNIFYKALFTTFLFPLFSIAQSNYKPGYVVTIKGDTVKGFIDYRTWRKNPKDIRFKKEIAEAKAESFSTKNTLAFTITGLEYYQRFVIQASQDQSDVSKLVQKADIVYVTDTVFLQTVNKGQHLILYNYTDNIKSRFYILEAGETQPQELIYHAFYLPGEVASIQYDHRYRDQLENLSEKYNADNKSLKEQISRANYSIFELTKIVQMINGNSQNQFTSKKVTGFRWFAGLDAGYSNFNLNGENAYITGQANSFSPKIKAGFDVFGDKNVQSVIIRAEFSFNMNHYNITKRNTDNFPAYTTSLDFKQYISAFTPQIMVNVLNEDAFKVFLGAGASISYANYSKHQVTALYDNGQYTSIDDYPPFTDFYFCYPLRASIVFNKKVEFSFYYVLSQSITSTFDYSGDVKSYGAGINYFFGGK